MSDEKLQKVLARAGLGSRREMERAIADGRITVNGKPATLSDQIESDARITLDGRPIKLTTPDSARGRVLLYNKPDNEICSRKDPVSAGFQLVAWISPPAACCCLPRMVNWPIS